MKHEYEPLIYLCPSLLSPLIGTKFIKIRLQKFLAEIQKSLKKKLRIKKVINAKKDL